MAKIAIEIECGLETCEKCRYVAGTASGYKAFCDYFNDSQDCGNSSLIQTPGHRTFFRLPECIAAEVKEC